MGRKRDFLVVFSFLVASFLVVNVQCKLEEEEEVDGVLIIDMEADYDTIDFDLSQSLHRSFMKRVDSSDPLYDRSWHLHSLTPTSKGIWRFSLDLCLSVKIYFILKDLCTRMKLG